MPGTSLLRHARELLHPLVRKRAVQAHQLRRLFVELTQRCNLACRHCGSGCTAQAQRPELTTDQWMTFFAYLPMAFEANTLSVVVTGGEPFCHPDLSKLLTALKANRLDWELLSNGWALNKESVQLIKDRGVRRLAVSLDGMSQSHDEFRGRRGAQDRVLRGIRNALEAKVEGLEVVTCVHPRNLVELPELEKLLGDLGVRTWKLSTIFPRGRAKEDLSLFLSPAQLQQLFGWIGVRRAALAGTGFDLQFSYDGFLPGPLDRQVRDEPYFCREGINVASVLCDGSISASPDAPFSQVQGNILTDDFRQVWDEGFVAHRERAWMRQGECADCAHFDQCQGNSLHLWDDEQKKPAQCHVKALDLGR